MNMLMKSGLFGKENLCTWLYDDHGADREYLNAPLLHLNPKGYVDLYSVPKYAYYFWQASYSEKPMIFILPHFWRSQYLGQKKDIVVTSNCDKVELKVNDASKGILVPDQSNYHTVTFPGITVENAVLSATGTRNGKTVTWRLTMTGEPAKIVLKTSHTKIASDRSSVVIIQADIVNSQGNHVYGANNSLKWTISGPAKLVGPDVYVSDVSKHHEMDGAWYIDAPVANVIRSTGDPGKIRVTVASGGLASGSVEISSETVQADNSIIGEPVLKNDGRTGIERKVLQSARLEDIPSEIKPIFNAIKISAANKTGYKKAVRDLLSKDNPKADTSSIEFKTLADLFASYLNNNNGHLIADDFNFNVEHFNNCRLIAGYVNATKLPQPFKDGLRVYYSSSIIREGSEKNAGDEMNWLNWIPSGGTVVYYNDIVNAMPQKGTLVSAMKELSSIITMVHPGFSKFSEEAKSRALDFIARMNPYVNTEVKTEIIDGKRVETRSLIAEKGKPVLIPLYKFIAE